MNRFNKRALGIQEERANNEQSILEIGGEKARKDGPGWRALPNNSGRCPLKPGAYFVTMAVVHSHPPQQDF